MNETELIKKAYEAIGTLTPLKSDCGRLCGAVCCKGDDETGMLLFPGEESLYKNDANFTVTVCLCFYATESAAEISVRFHAEFFLLP